jgi:anti-anti-sigma regulatory factor
MARPLPYRFLEMLKITPEYIGAEDVTLHLEGRVVGPWVDVLRASCREALARHDRVMLDFTNVSFVDDAAVTALRELGSERLGMKGCTGFIAQMLKEVRS